MKIETKLNYINKLEMLLYKLLIKLLMVLLFLFLHTVFWKKLK